LYHLAELLERSGFDRVLLCAGHLGAAVEAEARAIARAGFEVDVAHDGPIPPGTAGALRAALDRLDELFLVTYGDAYLPFDYAAPLRRLRADASGVGCMAVFENHDRIEPSNAAVRAGRVVRYDKSRAPGEPALDHIDYGATALRREAVASLEAGRPAGLDEVQADLARRGALLAEVAAERFFQIGSPDGLRELEAHLEARS
jgi:NDP-sugar pyrophosphorylase family protein